MEQINHIFNFLIFLLSTAINSSVPFLPTLPLIVFNYISNNFLFAFFSTIAGSALASYLQYLIANKIYNSKETKILKKIKYFINKKDGKGLNSLKKIDNVIRKSSFLDFLFFRISSLFPFKATNLYCGLIKYPLKRFLLVTIISQIPCNIIYYLSIKSNKFILSRNSEIKSADLNIDSFEFSFVNYLYLLAAIYFISKTVIFLIRKYNKIKN